MNMDVQAEGDHGSGDEVRSKINISRRHQLIERDYGYETRNGNHRNDGALACAHRLLAEYVGKKISSVFPGALSPDKLDENM